MNVQQPLDLFVRLACDIMLAKSAPFAGSGANAGSQSRAEEASAGNGLTGEDDETLAELDEDGKHVAPQPILPHLVTMSMLPKAQWQNLVHLDAIKVRRVGLQEALSIGP